MKKIQCLIVIVAGMVLLNSCGRKTETTKPVRKNITETVFASGVLIPENQYNLTAQSDGYLISLNFEEGDIVKTGDLLAVIDNKTYNINSQSADLLLNIAQANTSPNAPALKQIEVNVKVAEQKMNQDKQQAERYKKLYDSNSVSKLEYENMELAYKNSKANYLSLKENYNLQKQLAEQQFINQQSQSEVNKILQGNNELRAVVGGKVYTKYKELGDYVRRGEVMAIIGSPNNLYAKLSIDESSMSKIKLHQKVIVQLNTNEKHSFIAKITEIYPSFDKQTQSFYCKAVFTDSLNFLISGTQLQANIVTDKKENVLVIPRNFLDYGSMVNVKGEGKAKIETGIISSDWVEVTGGIDENTILVFEKK
ncbi:MAG: HlyD family efflux transporter periplasmic adaptor subunit [Planctomycetia bacterium]|nr:HlyD family efflux transporter periplasmic adaptor subunit [Planctomycetia bacterium]